MQTKEAKLFASGETRRLVSVAPETSAKAALAKMRETKIHHLVVLKDDRFLGVVSTRELVDEVDAGAWYGSGREVTVGEIMRMNIPVIDERTNVKAALSIMLERGLTALPYTLDGKVAGIITETDMLRLVERLLQGHDTFENLKTKGEVAVSNPLVQGVLKALGDAGI